MELNYPKYTIVSNLGDAHYIVVEKQNRFCRYLIEKQISSRCMYIENSQTIRFNEIIAYTVWMP